MPWEARNGETELHRGATGWWEIHVKTAGACWSVYVSSEARKKKQRNKKHKNHEQAAYMHVCVCVCVCDVLCSCVIVSGMAPVVTPLNIYYTLHDGSFLICMINSIFAFERTSTALKFQSARHADISMPLTPYYVLLGVLLC